MSKKSKYMKNYVLHFNFKEKVLLIEDVGFFEYETNNEEKIHKFNFELYVTEKKVSDFDFKIIGNLNDIKKILFFIEN